MNTTPLLIVDTDKYPEALLRTSGARGGYPAARRPTLLACVALLATLLTSCSVPLPGSPRAAAPQPTTAQTAPTDTPPATAVSIVVPTDAPPATAVPTADAAPNAIAAIKAAVQRGNEEQIQALASQDPTLMRDTSTAAYYQQAAQGVTDLASSGITAIELLKLEWGAITFASPTSAQVKTTETWRTTFNTKGVLEETDPNVYTLVQEQGKWKIQDDQHPSERGAQSTASPDNAPAPAAPAPRAETSRNWAGYTASGGTFTTVSGAWVVPTVAADQRSALDATWVGIGGLTTHDLIQAGTQAEVAGGQVRYSAWIELLPATAQTIPLTVNAGDTIHVTIEQQRDGTWLITVRDSTNSQVYQQPLTYQSSRSSAEWIEEAPASTRGILPLDNFGVVQFTDATAVRNGQQVTAAAAKALPVTMNGSNGQPLARPSGLAADGSSFSVTRI